MTRHYCISVKNRYNADCTIYAGTNLPKMAKVYSKLVNTLGDTFEFNLDIDENYDPDLGVFNKFEQIFDRNENQFACLHGNLIMDEIRKEFGDEGN